MQRPAIEEEKAIRPESASAAAGCLADRDVPIAIISDLHLNWSANWQEQVARLRPLWSGFRTVVFNGDTLDWYTAASRERQETVLTCLVESCASEGARALFLAGNSDCAITNRKHVVLMRELVLVTHGGTVFPAVSPWRRTASHIRRERESILGAMPAGQRSTLEGQLASAHEAMLRVQNGALSGKSPVLLSRLRERPWWMERPAGLWAIMSALRRGPRLAARFLLRYAPKADAIVLGHTHRSGVWGIDGKIVINTGGFGRFGRPALVSVDENSLAVRRITQDPREYVPGKMIARFSLEAGADRGGTYIAEGREQMAGKRPMHLRADVPGLSPK